MGGFSEEETDLIMVLTIIAACFSMLGALFMIVMFLGFSNLRGFAFRLILYLAISDAGSALFILIGRTDEDESLCNFQAVGLSYFGLASVLWAGVIAWTLFRAIVGQHRQVHKYELLYILGVNLYCLVMSLLPLSTDSYGHSSTGFCWVTEHEGNRDTSLAWQMLQFYLPLWLVVIFASYCYYRVYQAMKHLFNSVESIEEAERRERMRNISRLRFFPLVIVVAWFFGTINRFYLFSHYDDPNLTLTILHNVLGNLIGLMNSMVYGLNDQVKATLRHCCAKCLPCVDVPKNPPPGENYA